MGENVIPGKSVTLHSGAVSFIAGGRFGLHRSRCVKSRPFFSDMVCFTKRSVFQSMTSKAG